MTYTDSAVRFVSFKKMSSIEKIELLEFLRVNVIHPADGARRNGHADDSFSGFYSQENTEKIIRWSKEKGATEGHEAVQDELVNCP